MAAQQVKWKSNPLRDILRDDIVEGRIPETMKPGEAQKTRPEYIEMGKRFSSRLNGMRKSITKNPKPKKEEPWGNRNPVRGQMKRDVSNGTISEKMSYEDAIAVRAIYGEMTMELFKSRLKGMRDIVKKGKERALKDSLALTEDRRLHPRATSNFRGEPEWVGHEAKLLLEIDIDNGDHKRKSPEELYYSRAQYQDFELSTFRGHIYQEIHTRKWREQWVDGRKEYAIVPASNY